MELLELKGIKKSYRQGKIKVPALRGIDLKIEKGEFTTIFGPPDSGKTTLLNIISLLHKPTSGSIFFNGKELSNLEKKELVQFTYKNIGYICHKNYFKNGMTVYENIEYAAKFIGRDKKELKIIVDKALYDSRLDELKNKRLNELSNFRKKCLAIAMVMIKEPKLVLVDEPTTDIDPDNKDEIMNIMVNMNEELGITILYSTRISRIIDYAYRIIGIEDGMLTGI